METKANYTVIGAFTLAVIAGVFGFVYWFENSGGGVRTAYRIEFAGSVSGLRTGATVLFDGLQVGEVTRLALDPHDPRKVTAMIAVPASVPVRADTKVALQFQGLTGLAEVALTGGSPDAPLLVADAGGIPTLTVDRDAAADVTQEARNVLSRIDGLVADNEEALRASLRNIETVTSALAQNSQRLDHVMAGLETLAGGPDGKGQLGQAVEFDPAPRRQPRQTHRRDIGRSASLLQFRPQGIRGLGRRRPPHARRAAEGHQELRSAPEPADLRAVKFKCAEPRSSALALFLLALECAARVTPLSVPCGHYACSACFGGSIRKIRSWTKSCSIRALPPYRRPPRRA